MSEQSQSPQADSGILREAEHDRGLHEVEAEVTAIQRPTHGVLRISARLAASAEDPNWARPNVAFRIHLGPAHDDASRIYTVREYQPASGTLVFDVVLHEHASPMMQWSGRLRTGDRFRLTGPRPHLAFPEPGQRKIALFLDETAIPALYSLLPHWPAGATGIGWVACAEAAPFAELPVIPGLHLQRLPAAPGGSDGPLAAQALALAEPAGYVVWGAGERDEMRAIRRHFRDDVGLAREDVVIAGYWKRGFSNSEIDQRRRESYQRILARNGTLADLDDLALEI